MHREIPPQAVRVLDAALTCIGRVGLGKTTLDDVARERESAVLGAAAELVAPAFAPFLPMHDATRLAEWVARITLSYLCCPSEHLDVHDPVQVRALVDDFVLPGYLRPAGALEGVTP